VRGTVVVRPHRSDKTSLSLSFVGQLQAPVEPMDNNGGGAPLSPSSGGMKRSASAATPGDENAVLQHAVIRISNADEG
jgi:hypothetical protein